MSGVDDRRAAAKVGPWLVRVASSGAAGEDECIQGVCWEVVDDVVTRRGWWQRC